MGEREAFIRAVQKGYDEMVEHHMKMLERCQVTKEDLDKALPPPRVRSRVERRWDRLEVRIVKKCEEIRRRTGKFPELVFLGTQRWLALTHWIEEQRPVEGPKGGHQGVTMCCVGHQVEVIHAPGLGPKVIVPYPFHELLPSFNLLQQKAVREALESCKDEFSSKHS